MMNRLLELIEDDKTGKLSMTRFLALFTTIFIAVLVVVGLSGVIADYTLLGYLMSGYAPYVGKSIGEGLEKRG
jgi:hypothetical protein